MAERPEPPATRGSRSLAARLLGAGARSAERVAVVTGVDEAVEEVAEEAIVRAVESEAFERALARVLAGPAIEEAVARAVRSPAVERSIEEVLDSEMLDRVWNHLLASDEAQRLVERVAQAPEVRAAIAQQGVGLIGDIGHEAGQVTKRLDGVVERVARRLRGRPQREGGTDSAGAVTRLFALAIDAGILNLIFIGLSALVAFIATSVFDASDGASTGAVVVGVVGWIVGATLYLVGFWSLAGQTPGMRFLDIRLEGDGEVPAGHDQGIGRRRAIRRLVGLVLAALPLALGLLAMLFDDQRRGWHDRRSGTRVVYEPEMKAPWAVRPPRPVSASGPVSP